MTPFDELTLDEVEWLTRECLDGKDFQEAPPMTLAGSVMFAHERRSNPELTWADFKRQTRMFDIKKFSEAMNEDSLDPTNGVSS